MHSGRMFWREAVLLVLVLVLPVCSALPTEPKVSAVLKGKSRTFMKSCGSVTCRFLPAAHAARRPAGRRLHGLHAAGRPVPAERDGHVGPDEPQAASRRPEDIHAGSLPELPELLRLHSGPVQAQSAAGHQTHPGHGAVPAGLQNHHGQGGAHLLRRESAALLQAVDLDRQQPGGKLLQRLRRLEEGQHARRPGEALQGSAQQEPEDAGPD